MMTTGASAMEWQRRAPIREHARVSVAAPARQQKSTDMSQMAFGVNAARRRYAEYRLFERGGLQVGGEGEPLARCANSIRISATGLDAAEG